LVAALTVTVAGAPSLAADPAEEAVAARIVGHAMVDSRAWDKLAWLTDRIGHRLGGSEGLERAVAWTAEQFRRDGLEQVWTEKVMVPHWVRDHESARIVAPVDRPMATLALGGSVATPEDGLTAEVVAVQDFDELHALGDAVRGKIVLFNRPMRRDGGSEYGYGAGSKLRVHGPTEAARQGAVATLIRSLGTADYRLPHTGTLVYDADAPEVPAAAISVEDALLIQRLLDAGETVRVRMAIGARTLPDAESANVIAEIRGRERPEEIVLIGAHLDSWDVGSGAHDDGAGCAVVMETMRLLASSGLIPRRTIRAVLFTNEENGLRGGKEYAARHAEEAERHVAAIESDAGGGAPLGFGVSAGEGAVEIVAEIARHLSSIGASEVTAGGGGADISPLRAHGVPQLGLRQDTTHYFDYHHTEADTLDKVDRNDLDRNVAAMALMAYLLAEREEPLPRLPVQQD